MLTHFKQLDEILRGDATRLAKLQEGKIDIPIGGLCIALAVLALLYGLCMGSFAMIRTGGHAWQQLLAGTVKFPLLFLLTLVVTFPSLYVFNALIGSALSLSSVLRLLVASTGVILAVVASLGPIVVFFAVSTTSYSFMVLLNVAVCTIGGVLGLAFLLRTLHRLVMGKCPPAPISVEPVESGSNANEDFPIERPPAAPPASSMSALDAVGKTSQRAKLVFTMWVIVFALVGAQMSWVLRPFIGDPKLEFAWFRARESNFFLAVLEALGNLLTFAD